MYSRGTQSRLLLLYEVRCGFFSPSFYKILVVLENVKTITPGWILNTCLILFSIVRVFSFFVLLN